jgi:hypothetical protein
LGLLIRPSQPVRHFNRLAERGSVLLGLSGLARFALPGDDDGPDAQLVEVVIDFLLAVAAVGGDGAGAASRSG